MSIYIDEMYIGMMGPRLDLFTKTAKDAYNFRCPICGDSKTNPFKKRGYLIKTKTGDGYMFTCHNCGTSHSLYGFIKINFPDMFNQYKLETYISNGKKSGEVIEKAIMREPQVIEEEVESIDIGSIDEPVIELLDLDEDHPAVKYILETRKIPKELLCNFQYVHNYKDWIEGFNGEDQPFMKPHPRIMIPYRDRTGDVYRYLARSFTGKFGSKYLYTEIKEGFPFYGGYKIDKRQRVYIVEGPIDSMLLDNALAIGNATYTRGSFDSLPDYVIVPDNQPRNPEVVASIGKAIDSGHSVCLWPSGMTHKDINDLVMDGLTKDQIMSLIDENTYQGAKAKVKFSFWKKV